MTISDQEQRAPKDASGGCYIGIDLFKYEGGRRTYSVVLLCEGKVVSKYDDVGLEKVIRLCWEWEVSKLAIDNIAELAESKLELGRVVSLLPEKTSIYQINLSHGREKDFREMLRNMGIPTAQLTPSKTAYYLALLASMGVGEEVVKKEARTKIIVRKNRNLSSGGMSSNRYKRKVRTAILQIVNSIKEALDSSGFDYELLYRKAGGGLDGATFTVFAPRESLENIVKPKTGTSVSVEIRPEYKVKLLYEEKVKEAKPLIVGIDPGMTYGIAILDIDGNVIYIGSWQRMGRLEAVELIEKYGKPIVVATDVYPVPIGVKKIASQFGAELYVPDRVLTVEEKRNIIEKALEKGEIVDSDSHMRDAYAAAYMAYKAFSKKLTEVNKYLEKTGLDIPAENVKKRIIGGSSLADAVEEELKAYLSSVNKSIKIVVSPDIRKDEKYRRETDTVDLIRKENMILAKRIESLEEEIRRKERELELYKKGVLQLNKEDYYARELHRLKEMIAEAERTLKEKENELESISSEVQKLSSLLQRISRGEIVAVPIVPSLTKSNLSILPNVNGRIVFIENPDSYQREAVEDIKNMRPLSVIFPGPISNKGLASLLEGGGIPVLSLSDYVYERASGFLFVNSKVEEDAVKKKMELEKKLADKEKDKILSMLEKYKEQRRRT
jgi:hypothetical protein